MPAAPHLRNEPMESAENRKVYGSLLTPEICGRLAALHRFSGRQLLLAEKRPFLEIIRRDSVYESAYAACAFEGLRMPSGGAAAFPSARRSGRRTAAESALSGYASAIRILQGRHGAERFSPERLLEMQAELYFTGGGCPENEFRKADPKISRNGRLPAPAEILPHEEVESAVSTAFARYASLRKIPFCDEFLVASVFLTDFLAVLPFREANARLFFLVARLLLKRAGFSAADYLPLEEEFASAAGVFSEALFNSTVLWVSRENDYSYLTVAFLDILLSLCRRFEDCAAAVPEGPLSAKESVRLLLQLKGKEMTVGEISRAIDTVSTDRIGRIASELLSLGLIRSVPSGRRSAYKA